MLKPLLMVPALAFLGVPALVQQATPPPAGQSAASAAIPAEYVGKANPVKPTPEQQALAKKFYGWDCAMCHGETGNGKGDAADPAVPIRDFRDPASLAKLSDGEIFYIIQNGRGKIMPADGDRLKPDLIWNMVVYLRQMSNTPPTAATAQKD